MKKRFLNRVNLALGALSLALAGCHSAKQASSPKEPIYMVKYGVPAEWVAPAENVNPDTTATKPENPDEIVVTKYGIPAPLHE